MSNFIKNVLMLILGAAFAYYLGYSRTVVFWNMLALPILTGIGLFFSFFTISRITKSGISGVLSANTSHSIRLKIGMFHVLASFLLFMYLIASIYRHAPTRNLQLAAIILGAWGGCSLVTAYITFRKAGAISMPGFSANL